MNSEEPTLVITEDGSHTLHHHQLDETYHSIHGAIQESQHVFVANGLEFFLGAAQKEEIRILEYGLGTGLNLLLSLEALPKNIALVYHSIEKYPLPEELIKELNYGQILNSSQLLSQIHHCSWDQQFALNAQCQFKKINSDFRTFFPKTTYDLIYYDAFSPSKQPELWRKEIFENCFTALDEGGVLVTYSARGQLKRDLKEIGFQIESLPGPPGKYEMTRAIKLSTFKKNV